MVNKIKLKQVGLQLKDFGFCIYCRVLQILSFEIPQSIGLSGSIRNEDIL